MSIRRRLTSAAVAGIVGLLLASCAAALPRVHPDPAPAVPPPALDANQVSAVLTGLGAVLKVADATNDPAPLAARLSGPALVSRTAEYLVSAKLADPSVRTELPVGSQTVITPDTSTWPRAVVVVTEQPQNLQSPRVLTLVQDDPRSPYRLWGWARLLPDTKMPPTAAPTAGSTPLQPNAPGLVLTPKEVVEQYADVLAKGDVSTFASSFSPDVFHKQIETTLAATKTGLTQGLGTAATVTETYQPRPGELYSFSTLDGGALVIAGMTTTTSLTLSGGKIEFQNDVAALLGTTTVSSSATFVWSDVLVFLVPAKGSSALIQVLAAEHIRTAITGS